METTQKSIERPAPVQTPQQPGSARPAVPPDIPLKSPSRRRGRIPCRSSGHGTSSAIPAASTIISTLSPSKEAALCISKPRNRFGADAVWFPDKLLTLLSSDQGLMTAVVKNPGSGKSRVSAACEMLAYSEFCLFSGRTRYIIDSAELLNNFYSLRNSLTGLSLAAYLAELTKFVMPQKENAEEILRLLLNTLYLLEKGEKSERLLKAVYELRLMCLSGFQPDVDGCAGCGKQQGDFWSAAGATELSCVKTVCPSIRNYRSVLSAG